MSNEQCQWKKNSAKTKLKHCCSDKQFFNIETIRCFNIEQYCYCLQYWIEYYNNLQYTVNKN